MNNVLVGRCPRKLLWPYKSDQGNCITFGNVGFHSNSGLVQDKFPFLSSHLCLPLPAILSRRISHLPLSSSIGWANANLPFVLLIIHIPKKGNLKSAVVCIKNHQGNWSAWYVLIYTKRRTHIYQEHPGVGKSLS
jgi:hypothetical protein